MTRWRNSVARWEELEHPLRRLPRWGAIACLLLIAATMVWSALALSPAAGEGPPLAMAEAAAGEGDLALYRRIAERVTGGEDYYAAALDEHRASNYPATPFYTVRPPTLASVQEGLGLAGARMLALALLIAVILAFLWRFRGGAHPLERAAAGVLALFGGAAAITPDAGLIHELFAGLLLTLAFLLHRRAQWWPSLLLAALALAVRELAAPFVLLWLAFALAERRWKEAGALAALLALFAGAMYLHYLGVSADRLPGDGVSQGWNAMVGPALPLAALSELTILLIFPPWLAAPLAILPLIGWIGLGGRLGLFATLWFTGFFLAMALFARPENFYWVQLVLPAYLAGFAFLPRALADLVHAARARN